MMDASEPSNINVFRNQHQIGVICIMKNVLVTLPVKETHQARIRDAAQGCNVLFVPGREVTEEQVSEANVIIGNVPAKMIRGSERLALLQLESAGTDAYIACDTKKLDKKADYEAFLKEIEEVDFNKLDKGNARFKMSIANAAKTLEPKLRMLFFVVGGHFENRGDLLKTFLAGGTGKIGVFVAGL